MTDLKARKFPLKRLYSGTTPINCTSCKGTKVERTAGSKTIYNSNGHVIPIRTCQRCNGTGKFEVIERHFKHLINRVVAVWFRLLRTLFTIRFWLSSKRSVFKQASSLLHCIRVPQSRISLQHTPNPRLNIVSNLLTTNTGLDIVAMQIEADYTDWVQLFICNNFVLSDSWIAQSNFSIWRLQIACHNLQFSVILFAEILSQTT